LIVLSAVLLDACDRRSSPTNPTIPTAPAPTLTQLSISGLPAPLLFDIPSSLKAGDSYDLQATATYSDGSVRIVKPTAALWTSDDPSVASFTGSRLQARREGALRISLRVDLGAGVITQSRDLTVWEPGPPVREARAEQIPCDRFPACRYAFCPQSSPYWLFPVHEDGTIELIDAVNPGWGSPGQNVTQLSPKGERIQAWLLLKHAAPYKKAAVPGGFMYVFTMNADVGPCGDVSAVWTHPR
jgi:hypothetical protein